MVATCDYNYLLHFITVATLLFVCLFVCLYTNNVDTLKRKTKTPNNQKEPVAAASWRLEPLAVDQSEMIVGRLLLSLFLSQTNVAFT